MINNIMMTIAMSIIKYIANMVVTKLNQYLHVILVNKINVYVYAYINLYIKLIFSRCMEGTDSCVKNVMRNEERNKFFFMKEK